MHETVGTDSSMVDGQARRTWTSTNGRGARAAEKNAGLRRLEPRRCRTRVGGLKEIREVRPGNGRQPPLTGEPAGGRTPPNANTNRILTVQVCTPVLLLVCDEYSTTSLKQW